MRSRRRMKMTVSMREDWGWARRRGLGDEGKGRQWRRPGWHPRYAGRWDGYWGGMGHCAPCGHQSNVMFGEYRPGKDCSPEMCGETRKNGEPYGLMPFLFEHSLTHCREEFWFDRFCPWVPCVAVVVPTLFLWLGELIHFLFCEFPCESCPVSDGVTRNTYSRRWVLPMCASPCSLLWFIVGTYLVFSLVSCLVWFICWTSCWNYLTRACEGLPKPHVYDTQVSANQSGRSQIGVKLRAFKFETWNLNHFFESLFSIIFSITIAEPPSSSSLSFKLVTWNFKLEKVIWISFISSLCAKSKKWC